jgi:hypothetical protein
VLITTHPALICYVCRNIVSKPKVLEITPNNHVVPLHDVCAKNLRMLVKLLETADTTDTHNPVGRPRGKGKPKTVTVLQWLTVMQFKREASIKRTLKSLTQARLTSQDELEGFLTNLRTNP